MATAEKNKVMVEWYDLSITDRKTEKMIILETKKSFKNIVSMSSSIC